MERRMTLQKSAWACLIVLSVDCYLMAADPCWTYGNFSADYKRSPSHTETELDNAECDVTLTQKWYRIVGDAGTDLTNDSGLLQNNVCGTVNQMWMNGNIPEESEGIVDRQICLRTVFSICHYSFTIQVKNCCSFRVYYLNSASGCPHAYCVSDTNITSPNQCSNATVDTSAETMAIDTTSVATTKATTDSTSVPATSTGSPVTHAEGSTTSSTDTDPCLTYEKFSADYKRSPSHTETEFDNAECDVTLTQKWYRIVGDAGTDLTNDSGLLRSYGCGTVNQMWMNGNIPEESEGIVDRQICLRTVFSICHYSFTIQVKNCCSFRVYYLNSASGCPHAYCVSGINFTSWVNCSDSTYDTRAETKSVTSTSTYGPMTHTGSSTTLAYDKGSEYKVVKKDYTIFIVVFVALLVVLVAGFIGFFIHASKIFKKQRSVSTLSLMSWFHVPAESHTPPVHTTEDHALQSYQGIEKGGVSEIDTRQNEGVPGEVVEKGFVS